MILGLRTLHRRSYGAATWTSAGRPTSTAVSSTFRGSWQPANGRDLELLPEGDRAKDTRKVYTTTALRTEDQHGGTTADQVSPDNSVWYRVMAVTPFEAEHPIPHYRALCVRVQEVAT